MYPIIWVIEGEAHATVDSRVRSTRLTNAHLDTPWTVFSGMLLTT